MIVNFQSELETGWFPTTPSSDTYLRRFLLNWAEACTATAQMHGGEARDIGTAILADARRPAGFGNCALLLQPLSTQTTPTTMERLADFFRFDDPARSGWVLLFSAWPTGDLRQDGWSLMGHPPLHFLPAGKAPRPSPSELRIEEVRDLAALQAWERIVIAGYPMEELKGTEPGVVTPSAWLDERRARLFVGWAGDRPVAASSAWIAEGVNNVTLVVTLPDARRRGFGEALTWRAALADPSLPAMLLSSDDGRPVYERMGFLPLFRFTLWYHERP